MSISRFNIRVYMLLLNDNRDRILLSDEIVQGEYYTKFPGGGLEYGEGLLDCLHREAMEEFGQDVEVIQQFYTTEKFQGSRFIPQDQIICVYYECLLPLDQNGKRQPQFRVSEKAFDFIEHREREESFRWRALDKIKPEELALPLDRDVLLRFLQSLMPS